MDPMFCSCCGRGSGSVPPSVDRLTTTCPGDVEREIPCHRGRVGFSVPPGMPESVLDCRVCGGAGTLAVLAIGAIGEGWVFAREVKGIVPVVAAPFRTDLDTADESTPWIAYLHGGNTLLLMEGRNTVGGILEAEAVFGDLWQPGGFAVLFGDRTWPLDTPGVPEHGWQEVDG